MNDDKYVRELWDERRCIAACSDPLTDEQRNRLNAINDELKAIKFDLGGYGAFVDSEGNAKVESSHLIETMRMILHHHRQEYDRAKANGNLYGMRDALDRLKYASRALSVNLVVCVSGPCHNEYFAEMASNMSLEVGWFIAGELGISLTEVSDHIINVSDFENE